MTPAPRDRPYPWALWTGAASWLLGAVLLIGSVQTVRARALRTTMTFDVSIGDSALRTGDRVFVEADRGLLFVGEVIAAPNVSVGVRVAIHPEALGLINTSTAAVCWKTPLSAEEAINALLPREIQTLAARRISTDWRRFEGEVAATWGPLLQELSRSFFDAISDDINQAFERHEADLLAVAATHGEAWSSAWPTFQRQLGPILQTHLTPVLGRLLNDAVSDAHKLRVGLSIARGRHAEAYQQMLDWLTDYLADMPEKDRVELREALRKAWLAAGADEVLQAESTRLGRDLLNDPDLHRVLREVYQESVTENPRAAEFFRTQVVDSPQFRKHFFGLVDLLAPTMRDVAALSLFDETGATRPEVVHVLRSVALQREMAWITLVTPDPSAEPLPANATIVGRHGGAP